MDGGSAFGGCSLSVHHSHYLSEQLCDKDKATQPDNRRSADHSVLRHYHLLAGDLCGLSLVFPHLG